MKNDTILLLKQYTKWGKIEMLFFKKRDINETKPFKQEIFEDVIYSNKILTAISIIEAVAIVGLCIALIFKGA